MLNQQQIKEKAILYNDILIVSNLYHLISLFGIQNNKNNKPMLEINLSIQKTNIIKLGINLPKPKAVVPHICISKLI